jgi:hypothetical protein
MWSFPGNMPKYYPGLREILPVVMWSLQWGSRIKTTIFGTFGRCLFVFLLGCLQCIIHSHFKYINFDPFQGHKVRVQAEDTPYKI